MKKINILFLLVLIFNYPARSTFAQDNSNPFDGASFGLTVAGLGNNETFAGLDLMSPYFCKKRMAVRVGVEGLLYNYIPENKNRYVNSTYHTLCLGIRIRTNSVTENLFFRYGEVGGLGIIPNNNFTNEKFPIGLYLKYGFEYTVGSRKNYGFFIEANVKVSNLRAEKALGSPYYSNGGNLAIGLRRY